MGREDITVIDDIIMVMIRQTRQGESTTLTNAILFNFKATVGRLVVLGFECVHPYRRTELPTTERVEVEGFRCPPIEATQR